MLDMTLEQAMRIALQQHNAGQFQQAEQLYRRLFTQAFYHAADLRRLGQMAYQTGRNDVAVQFLRRAILLLPNDAALHFDLANALTERSQLDESITEYRRAIAVKPDYAAAFNNLGIALMEKGQLDDAIAAWRQATVVQPNHADAYSNLGVALQNIGQVDEAVDAHRRAIALRPDFPQALSNLGFALASKGQFEESIAVCRQAIALQPTHAEAYNNLGIALAKQGLTDDAIAAYHQAIAIKPNYLEALNNFGVALKGKAQLDDAIAVFRQAVALQPQYAEAQKNLGGILLSAGKLDEATEAFRHVIELRPEDADSHDALGTALYLKGNLDAATAAYRRAITLNPSGAEIYSNLGHALKDQGRLEEARIVFEQAVALAPANASILSNLLLLLNYHPGHTAERIFREQRRWNERFGSPKTDQPGIHRNTPVANRRLRVGYVSPDFRTHALSKFLLPIIECHDRSQVEVFCYSDVARADQMTAQFRERADVWRTTAGVSGEQLAEQIRADAIDILVDLAMHSADNRLTVFARRPAPVQVTWLAYPGGTGLDAIDYRITDRFLDPLDPLSGSGLPNVADVCYTEISVRMPDCWTCYRPLRQSPEVNSLPALNSGRLTFGCLNNFCKLNDEVLKCWCRLLHAVPNARLLLHGSEGSHRNTLRDAIAQQEIDPSRLDFVAYLPETEYLRIYHQIDIGLDPFPCSGGVTSCDSLWMGVPVVSLKGRTAVGRGTATLLYNAGFPELVADSEGKYIEIAKGLATDLPRLIQMRSSIRQKLQASPMMDELRFTRNLESAYRTIWQRWCETIGWPLTQK